MARRRRRRTPSPMDANASSYLETAAVSPGDEDISEDSG